MGAIFIIIIAMFFFNSDLTGFGIKELSASGIEVSPKAVNVNEKVFITVYPGLLGVNNQLNFYNAEDDLRKSSIELCEGDFKCTEESTIGYWIPNGWKPGVYYVKVYDYDRKGFIIEDFTIKRGE